MQPFSVFFPDLMGHDEKVTSDKKLIYISHQRYKGGNGNYIRHFLVTFKTTCTLVIVFVRLILGNKGEDRFTGPRQKSDTRYEFVLKLVIKRLRCK